MELQIPYSNCAQIISKESVFRRKEKGGRKNTATVMRMERDKDNRSGGMPRPCAYAVGDTAKSIGVELYGVSEREE